MADRYLLESGAPDGYLLEDGSGVFLLELGIAPTSLGVIPRVDTPSVQGGYSTVPNLLLTTLAVVAATAIPRAPLIQNQNPPTPVQAFQPPNLLTSTLTGVVPVPPGEQRVDSSPPAQVIGTAAPTQSRALLENLAQPLPIGVQQTASAPPTPRVLFWDKGTNTLLFTTPPIGRQQVDSAPSVKGVQAVTPPQIQPPSAAASPLPVGQQKTDSAPPTSRIGSILFARGVDPEPPVPPVEIAPVGTQRTESAPYKHFSPVINEPQNLLAGPLAYAPIPSVQLADLRPIPAPQVIAWQGPNTTILLPVTPAQAIPPGEQRTESAPIVRNAVTVITPPQILPPALVVQALPIGRGQVDSAPSTIFRPLIDLPQNLLAGPLGLPPIASQQSNYLGPVWTPPIVFWQAPNVTISLPLPPAPMGRQQTTSAPVWNTSVQSYVAPNATLFIPPPNPLPVGGQHTDSAPIWAVPVGMSVGWTIPPDLLPPYVPPPEPVVRVEIGGGIKKHKSAKEEREEFLDLAVKEVLTPAKPAPELPKPLKPVQTVKQVVADPPKAVQLTMVKKIELPDEDDKIIAALIAAGLF